MRWGGARNRRIIGGMRRLHRIIVCAGCASLVAAAAHAVAQDKVVLGVELGAPFLASACGPGETVFPVTPCFDGGQINRMAWGAEEYYVSIPKSGTPPYVRGEIKVLVVRGVVESVEIGTWGIQAQGIALETLTKKYGRPTRVRQERQNTLRSRFPVQFAEWEFADFAVRLDGTTGSIDWGRIEVSLHRYRKRVGDYRQQHPAQPPR